MSSPNTWYHRKVADSAAKACWICYKPTPSVLITPDDKAREDHQDFFYICVGHLKDRGFCQPDADEAAAAEARKKKEDMDREIEKVKQEYEEKQKKKGEKRKEKKKSKTKDKEAESKKSEEEEDEKDEKEKDEKIQAISTQGPPTEELPRIYSLQKHFYQMRVDRKRHAEMAKRNRERLKDPSAFPSAPSGGL